MASGHHGPIVQSAITHVVKNCRSELEIAQILNRNMEDIPVTALTVKQDRVQKMI